jgi:hypothetical protein
MSEAIIAGIRMAGAIAKPGTMPSLGIMIAPGEGLSLEVA